MLNESYRPRVSLRKDDAEFDHDDQLAWDAGCRARGFPWCDTCGHAAVWHEWFGWRHSTETDPFGIDTADLSDHEVTATQWYRS